MGRVTSRTYNARGQETSVTLPDPDGAGPLTAPVFTKAFNARGELVSQADAMGNITSWTYNAQGQALTQTDPDPDGAGPLPAAVTTFTYDLRGLRSSVTDASGNTTSYGYDHAGRLVEEIDPRGNSSYYQYDVAGQVTRVVDRNSRKRDFTYNDLGLVTEEVWVDGFGNTVKTIVHGYDDAGREISISDGVTAYQYQYDLADRVIYTDNAGSVDMPQVQLISYYDFEGNRTWLGDNLGGGISYAWNNQRLQSMALYTENYKSAQVGFSYDTVGRLSSLTRTANWDYTTTINTTFTLDLLDRVTSITHSKGMGEDASTLSQFTYGYDVGGRVTNYTGPEGSLSYALDANGQLLSVTGSRTDNYSFDANGNRSSNTTAAGNLLLNDGKYSYTYDLEGNQKTKTRISDGQVTEFFWDYRNQLTKAMVKDANGVLLKELRFTYDVEGRRVGVWVDADGAGPEEPDQVWTVFDGVNPYMDFDGELQTRYLYGPGIDELFARIGTGEDPQWYLADRLGSVRQIVDASGAVLDEITYDSFGGILSESNSTHGDRFKFTGREFSPELGIYYYRARWYDPGSGRFISQDPIGFSAGDANLYRYVGNAPGDATDPEGLKVYWCGRVLDSILRGNHHFIMVVPDNPKDFPGMLIDLFGGNKGLSLGGFEKDGWLVYEKNQKADIAAYREFSNHKEYARCPDKYKSGWSLERHEVPAPKGMTDTDFIKKLLEGALNYEKNSEEKCFKFGLFFGPNCASWTNSLFNHAGIGEADRFKLGEFSGLDWGEEVLIDDGMWNFPKKK